MVVNRSRDRTVPGSHRHHPGIAHCFGTDVHHPGIDSSRDGVGAIPGARSVPGPVVGHPGMSPYPGIRLRPSRDEGASQDRYDQIDVACDQTRPGICLLPSRDRSIPGSPGLARDRRRSRDSHATVPGWTCPGTRGGRPIQDTVSWMGLSRDGAKSIPGWGVPTLDASGVRGTDYAPATRAFGVRASP